MKQLLVEIICCAAAVVIGLRLVCVILDRACYALKRRKTHV
ncbi:MAG: hypothetical protein QMD09_04175 [Desulfatibacillaceae bacterium]|nr:hypothetical protein [Desulfatibacillaceae bacterium]